MGYTLDLCSYVANLNWRKIPSKVVQKCKVHMLDTLGVALRGSLTSHSQQTVKVIRDIGCEPQCTIVGHSFKTSMIEAAFLNSIMAHSIDFDDGHKFIHPGCVIIPVSLSIAEQKHLTGEKLIVGIIAGYEISIRTSLAAGLKHRKRGYHPTATCNFFGAAAAAANLLNLSPLQVNSAFGLACTQAAGVTQYRFDGSPNKHFHAGMAARGGMLSVLLALSEFRGTKEALEGEFGFLNVMAEGGEPELLVDGLGDKFAILETEIKPYPSCRQTHAPIDLVLEAVHKYDIDPENIWEVLLYTYEYAYKSWLINTEPPSSKLQAMLNIPYCMAIAFIDGKVTLDQFREGRLKDKNVHDLLKKITIRVDDDFSRQFSSQKNARLQINFKDGSTLTLSTQNPRGSVDKLLTFSEVVTKFRELAEPVIGEKRVEDIIERVNRLEDLTNVGELVSLLALSS